jgi:hypothetical protein
MRNLLSLALVMVLSSGCATPPVNGCLKWNSGGAIIGIGEKNCNSLNSIKSEEDAGKKTEGSTS